MSKKIKIICDNIEYNLETVDDKTILDIALDNDIDAPYSCQGGICSTCLAKINKGSVEMDNNQILTDDEVEDGYILTCQARITSDEVEISYDDVSINKNIKSFYQVSKKVYSNRLSNDLGYSLIYPKIDEFLNSLLKKN